MRNHDYCSKDFATTPGCICATTPSCICETTPGCINATDNIIRAIYVLNFYYLLHKRNNGEFLVEPAVVQFSDHGGTAVAGKPGHGEFEKKAVAAM